MASPKLHLNDNFMAKVILGAKFKSTQCGSPMGVLTLKAVLTVVPRGPEAY